MVPLILGTVRGHVELVVAQGVGITDSLLGQGLSNAPQRIVDRVAWQSGSGEEILTQQVLGMRRCGADEPFFGREVGEERARGDACPLGKLAVVA